MTTVFDHLAKIERTAWALYCAGLLTRLLFVGFLLWQGGVSAVMGADHSQYQALANNLVAHHAFSLSSSTPFVPDGLRTPGYPLFLALSVFLTGGFLLALLLQAFLGAFIPVLVRRIGLTLGLSKRASLLAALVGIVDLNFLANTASFQTEGLFMPLFLFVVLYLLRAMPHLSIRHASILGFFFGVLALVRPAFLYVGVGCFVVVFFLMHRPYRKAATVAVAGLLVMLATLSPWLLRNHAQFGAYSLSSIGPVNLYTRLAVSVLAVRDGVPPFWGVYKEALDTLVQRGEIPDLTYPEHESVLYDTRYNNLFTRETLHIIHDNPASFWKLQANSVFAILTHDNTLNILQEMHIAPVDAYPHFSVSLLFMTVPFHEFVGRVSEVIGGWYALPFIGRAVWIVVSLLALYGVRARMRVATPRSPERPRTFLILYFIGAFIVVTLPVALSIDARMRVPIEPFLLLLASAGGAAFFTKFRLSAHHVH